VPRVCQHNPNPKPNPTNLTLLTVTLFERLAENFHRRLQLYILRDAEVHHVVVATLGGRESLQIGTVACPVVGNILTGAHTGRVGERASNADVDEILQFIVSSLIFIGS